MLNAKPDARADHDQHQAQRVSPRPQQKQTEQGEQSRHRIEGDHNLAGRHAVLEQLVMNVITIRLEYGLTANQSPQDRQSGLKNRQTEGDDRNSDSNHRRGLLGALQCQGTQYESDEQTSAVTEKDGRRIEVKTEKSQDGSSQGNGQQGDQ